MNIFFRHSVNEFSLKEFFFHPKDFLGKSIKILSINHPIVSTICVVAFSVFAAKALISGYIIEGILSGCLALIFSSSFKANPKDFFQLFKHTLAVQYYSLKLWLVI
jgi:hypothetical protein